MSIIDDIRALQVAMRDVTSTAERNAAAIARLEETISGARGLSAALNELAEEVKALRRAAYWVAGLIVAGAITFAFSVLTVFGA